MLVISQDFCTERWRYQAHNALYLKDELSHNLSNWVLKGRLLRTPSIRPQPLGRGQGPSPEKEGIGKSGDSTARAKVEVHKGGGTMTQGAQKLVTGFPYRNSKNLRAAQDLTNLY